MAGKTDGEPLDRLDRVLQVIAEDRLSLKEDRLSLKKLIAELATETSRRFDQVAAQARRTDERNDELVVAIGETDKKARRTDERIDKLVVAIGELIRHQKTT